MKAARYEQSFKVAAVKRVVLNGQSISGAAREVGVTVTSLRKWISNYNSQLNTVESSKEDHELLKKRLQELISERATLKATLLILLKEQIKIEENEGRE
jgi:transposase-like protein